MPGFDSPEPSEMEGLPTGEPRLQGELVPFASLAREEWESLQRASSRPYSIHQCYLFGQAMRSIGRDVRFFTVRQETELVGGLMLLAYPTKVGTVYQAEGGPLSRAGSEERVGAALAKRFTTAGRSCLGFRLWVTPAVSWDLERWGLHRSRIRRYNAVLDVSKPEPELWKGLGTDKRRRVKSSTRQGFKVVAATTREEWMSSFEVQEQHAQEHGYEVEIDRRAWSMYYETLRPASHVTALTCLQDGQVTGTIVVLSNGLDVAKTGPVANAPGKGRDGSMVLLMWEAIRWAHARGHRIFSMGGIPPPGSAISGIGDFKMSFGAEAALLGEYVEGRRMRFAYDAPGLIRSRISSGKAGEVGQNLRSVRHLARRIIDP